LDCAINQKINMSEEFILNFQKGGCLEEDNLDKLKAAYLKHCEDMNEVFYIRNITDENGVSVATFEECSELESEAYDLIGEPEGNWIEEAARDALHGKLI